MTKNSFLHKTFVVMLALALLLSTGPGGPASAQDEPAMPILFDPLLDVRTFVSGLESPTSLAFLDEDELFVLEKNTGQVEHLVGNAMPQVVLDLAVNFSSERGLLGIALDPDFANNNYVYLYWTCSAPPPTATPYFPSEIECPDEPQLGEDTDDVLAVPLLGNRVDRFVWNGTSLTWDLNLVKLRVFQNDGAPIPRGQGDQEQMPLGNHDAGVITFGADDKLYVIIGDVGRRGALQNLPLGPIPYEPLTFPFEGLPGMDAPFDPSADRFSAPDELPIPDTLSPDLFPGLTSLLRFRLATDDQFGGPQPDDAHFTGVILRLNNDGSIPIDNPFYQIGAQIGGEIGENIQMTFAYGIRNSFGMDIDPLSGNLWISENGEDAFDELNLVFPGQNSGWIQVMGPLSRISEYREIETTSLHFEDFPNLQQFRWPPENIAVSPLDAFLRLSWLPGSSYSNPEFSWKYVVAPAAIGFAKNPALGDEFYGDLFVGLSVPMPLDGPLFRFELTEDRMGLAFDDPRLEDRVADNLDFNDLTESESLLIGSGFGVVTDIETAPNGNLFVVSLSNGAIYEIFRRTDAAPSRFMATLTGMAEVPGPGDPDGSGSAVVTIDQGQNRVCFAILVANISLPATGAHIHVGEAGVAGDIVVPLTPPDESGASAGCVEPDDPSIIPAILQNPAGYYVNVHTTDYPAGAVRGQLSTLEPPAP